MLRRLTTSISPTSCLAMVALFVALGGGAYAATGQIGSAEIKNGAVTKAKIKKEAVTGPKIKADAVTGAKVRESSLATVPDAAKLAGRDPSGFESKGFGGEGDSKFVTLPKDAVTEVRSLALPAGTYMVLARGGLNNNDNGDDSGLGQECTLAVGGIAQTIEFSPLAKSGAPGDREEFSVSVIATLPVAGSAVLSCETNSNWTSGNVTDPMITAVSLQP